MKKKFIACTALLAGAIVGLTSVLAIDKACKRPINQKDKPLKEIPKEYSLWLNEQTFEDLEITSHDGLKLRSKLLKAEGKSNKVLIAIHGYHSYNLREYARYLKFYHELGFHILLPNNRAHGNSEGEYIGFGWLDRIDCLQWIDTMKLYFHDQDIQIVLHGISMGSATVLMASGEELPSEVKCIISDCGFTSVYEEMKHEMKRSHIPTVILPTATLLSKKRVGYNFKEASTINQVKKSHTPTLFIHGDQDDFVPTYMVYDLYNACQAPKDLLIVEGAKHAESYIVNQELCEKTIVDFMSKYVKL